jgi:hypothetical protein
MLQFHPRIIGLQQKVSAFHPKKHIKMIKKFIGRAMRVAGTSGWIIGKEYPPNEMVYSAVDTPSHPLEGQLLRPCGSK